MTTGTILMWAATQFTVTAASSVILIQRGGWLPILAAVLLLLFYFINIAVMVTLTAECIVLTNKKEEKTE